MRLRQLEERVLRMYMYTVSSKPKGNPMNRIFDRITNENCASQLGKEEITDLFQRSNCDISTLPLVGQ